MRLKPPIKALVVIKRTKLELDLVRYRTLKELKKIYKLQGNFYEKVLSSHKRQLESREFLQKTLSKNYHFIFREEIPKVNFNHFPLVIALGGDNHFTYVSHFAIKNIILGCNSDPETSVGALLNFNTKEVIQLVKNNFQNGEIENWTLIEVEIKYPNGKKIKTYKAVSEISVRNNNPDLISRFIISHREFIEEHKCSGLLVYTGAGSTGWVMASENKNIQFAKEEPCFKVYCRELREKKGFMYNLSHFKVSDSFKVISEMDGGISIDSLTETIYDFPPGAIATFKVSQKKLKVIVKN